ncbi:MAG: MBL fold metallo-hydrolase [Bellilinea sp.]
MVITFLGTSGANSYPEAFCKCHHCEKARTLGGPSLRKRSALLINEDLLVDLGPDIMTAAQEHRYSLTQVRYCIQTHPHADHLDVSHLLSRSPDHGVVGAPCLNFYASEETLERAAQTFRRDLSDRDLLSPITQEYMNLKVYTIKPFQPIQIGNYQITAFPANHAPTMGAMLYSVEDGNRCIFYGTDTAPLLDQTWQAFHQQKLKFDIVILDHTYGLKEPANDHMNAYQVIEHIVRMRNEDLLTNNARVFATHIAHEGNPPHPDLVAFAKQHGYEVAYDGLRLEIPA